MRDLVRTGKFLSLILRHQPEVAGITLDSNGWADVDGLLAGMRRKGHPIDMVMLEEIVDTNDKKRYIFNEDKTKIRANQGHSVQVDVELKEAEPPEYLYHGTADRFVDVIMKTGLQKQSRNHVHLSKDRETAVNVGGRHGKPMVLRISARDMRRDGYIFYLSENGVWLVDEVPVFYIEF